MAPVTIAWVADGQFQRLCGFPLSASDVSITEKLTDRSSVRACAQEAAMKLAIAAVATVGLLLGSLSLHRVLSRRPAPLQPAARAAPTEVEKRVRASIDRSLHRRLRVLARR
jgi:hypothetical protein